ncbi:MAG: hypothetical protein J6Z36_02145 [Clostridia bacterium]|nr:hypothetical protein [Clostridia bacterium]
MMKITKLQEENQTFPSAEEFVMQETPVQGAQIGKRENDLYIVSPRRFKLFTTGMDRVYILEGNGFFKWKRGETKFSAGDVFTVEEVGEYEINGNGKYFVVRK